MADINSQLLEQFREEAADAVGGDPEAVVAEAAPESEVDPEAEAEAEVEAETPEAEVEAEAPAAAAPVVDVPVEEPEAVDYSDVPESTLVESADQYPLQAFQFALDNAPQAAPAVLSRIAEENPALAFDLLMGWTQTVVSRATEDAVAPVRATVDRADAEKNALAALRTVSTTVKDAHELAEVASQLVEARKAELKGHSQHDIEEFLKSCYEQARKLVDTARGGKAKAAKQEKATPAPVITDGAAAAVSEASSEDDPWESMQQFRSVLGI